LGRLRKSNRITSTPAGGRGGTFPTTTRKKSSVPPAILPPPPPPFFYSDLEHEGVRVSLEEDSTQTKIGPKPFPTPTYHLQWTAQRTHFLSEISAYFELGHFVDVTLIPDRADGDGGGNCGIRAHKIILATSSDYFRRILEESPCKHPVIHLKGFSRWEAETLLRFMYTGEVQLDSAEQAETLLRVAEVLQVSLL